MFRVKKSIPSTLQEKFPLIQYIYPTKFSKNNLKESKLNLMITKFAMQGEKYGSENGSPFLAERP